MDEAAAVVHKQEEQLLQDVVHRPQDDYHTLLRYNLPKTNHTHLQAKSSSLHFSIIW
jgi:hypothetical protein